MAGAAPPRPTATTRLRSHRRLTDDEKRVKQRQLVKRSYYRKLDTLSTLRDEVAALEREFRRVLCAVSARGGSTNSPRARFAALAETQSDLRLESSQLRAHAMEQSKARERMRLLLAEELRALSEGPRPPPEVPKTAIPVAGMWIRPLTASDCERVRRAAATEVRAFLAAEREEPGASTGARVFGWRDHRRVDADGRQLRFCLEKTFRGLPAREVARRMWALVSTARGLSRIYAAVGGARFELLQHVDASNVLFYRELRSGGAGKSGAVLKTFVLASLVDDVPDEGDALVLLRSVDPRALLVARSLSESTDGRWTDVFSWGTYERAGRGGADCRNAFGGVVPTASTAATSGALDAARWLLLVLDIAVRCESAVVGAPALLWSD